MSLLSEPSNPLQASGTRKRDRQESRDSILRAAMDVFANLGFQGATAKVIAQASGCSEALLFRYLKDKHGHASSHSRLKQFFF